MDAIPVQYHIEIYENSFINDPSIAWHGSTPLPALNVGDYFNPSATGNWYEPLGKDETFSVKRIEHIFWEIEGSHIGHKLMVCLEKVPYPED